MGVGPEDTKIDALGYGILRAQGFNEMNTIGLARMYNILIVYSLAMYLCICIRLRMMAQLSEVVHCIDIVCNYIIHVRLRIFTQMHTRVGQICMRVVMVPPRT